ncbi:MAG: hypothetical protein ABJM29_19165 [Rhizobiaceae bacterium]
MANFTPHSFKVKYLWLYLKRLWAWLVGALFVAVPRLFLALLPLAVVFVATWWPDDADAAETAVRITGMVLQLFGFILSLWGLLQLRRLFGRPGPWGSFLNLFPTFPSWPGTHHLKAKGAAAIVTGGDVVVAQGSTEGSLDDRIRKIERDMKALREQLKQEEKSRTKETQETRRLLQDTEKRLLEKIAEVQSQVEQAAVGGHFWEFFGVWLFIVGVIAASVSQEIVRMASQI